LSKKTEKTRNKKMSQAEYEEDDTGPLLISKLEV
jgi:hypothetical protein